MKLTDRDIRLVRDVALSHVMSRDQIIRLGYFGSVARANARLLALRKAGFLQCLTTPFFCQHLYAAGKEAKEVVGERIAALLLGRKPTPRFVQHAMAVTDVRTTIAPSCSTWRFEAQVRQAFTWLGKRFEVRPDGVAIGDSGPILIEVDLGHVSSRKFQEKTEAYAAYRESGTLARAYGNEPFAVLTITTSQIRKENLVRAASSLGANFLCQTFDEVGIRTPGGWS